MDARQKDRLFRLLFPYVLGGSLMALYFVALNAAPNEFEFETSDREPISRSRADSDHARELASRMASYEKDNDRDEFYKALSPYERRILFRFDLDVRSGRQSPAEPVVAPSVKQPEARTKLVEAVAPDAK